MGLEDAADALGMDGVLVPDLSFDGRSFAALIDVDHEEVSRRDRFRLGPVLEPSVLEAIGTLPLDLPVKRSEIDPVCQAVLDVAPPGLVSSSGGSLVRIWRPAVRIKLILVRRHDWNRGLATISMFAADGPRALVSDRVPRDLGTAGALAKKIGAGFVVVRAGNEARVIARPSLRWLGRSSTRHWEFLEVVYRGWRTRSGSEAQAFR